MDTGNFSFYDPGWILVDAIVLLLTALIPFLIVVVAYFLTKRYYPKHQKIAKKVMFVTGIGLLFVVIATIFVIDILKKPEWLPFITNVRY